MFGYKKKGYRWKATAIVTDSGCVRSFKDSQPFLFCEKRGLNKRHGRAQPLGIIPFGFQQGGDFQCRMALDQVFPFQAGSGPMFVTIWVFQPPPDIFQSDFNAGGIFPNTCSRQLGQLEANPILPLVRTTEFHGDFTKILP
jgi:hypothetical protein